MPVYFLTNELYFPDPGDALEDGLLALGGDLKRERLLLAYRSGIFPWYAEGSPILWWSPDPRMILYPHAINVSKSLWQLLNRDPFEVRFDTRFGDVIRHCARAERKGQDGTWINEEMIAAYENLHREGYAHSVECYRDGRLSGGLYGLSLGKAFFGESMFYRERDTSKVALYHLAQRLRKWNFHFIDAQQETEHLRRFGALPVPRREFLGMLRKALKYETLKGPWTNIDHKPRNHSGRNRTASG